MVLALVLVKGHPGVGKSTLARWVLWQALQAVAAGTMAALSLHVDTFTSRQASSALMNHQIAMPDVAQGCLQAVGLALDRQG